MASTDTILKNLLEQTEAALTIISNFDKNKFFKNFSIFFSISLIHFTSYLQYFDINSSIIMDTSTVSKYFWNMSIAIIASLGLSRIILFFTVNFIFIYIYLFITYIVLRIKFIPKIFIDRVSKRLNNNTNQIKYLFYRYIRFIFLIIINNLSKTLETTKIYYILSIFIFLFIYLGPTLSAILIFQLYLLFVLFAVMKNFKLIINLFIHIRYRNFLFPLLAYITKNGSLSAFEILTKITTILYLSILAPVISITNDYKKYLGFFLIFTAFYLGEQRAKFVLIHYKFQITQENGTKETGAIFLTSSSGLFLWNERRTAVEFYSWSKGLSAQALPSHRRSFRPVPSPPATGTE